MWAPGTGIRHRIRKPTVARTEQSGCIFLLESDNCTYSPKLAAVLTVLLWHLLPHEVDSPSRSVCPVSPRPTKDAQHCTVPRGFSSHSTLLPRTPRLLQAEAKVLHPPHPQGVFPTARTYAESPSPTWSFSHYFRLFHYHPIMESLTPLSQLFWGTTAHTAPRLWTESINVCALLTCWQGTP